MKLCPKCQKQFSDDANFCPVDAARLTPIDGGAGWAAVRAPPATAQPSSSAAPPARSRPGERELTTPHAAASTFGSGGPIDRSYLPALWAAALGRTEGEAGGSKR